ncbi:MAG: NADP-dependent oxidoreductase [Candidatus Tectomicrobia bacterium]|uniref:NADP-dependent oxidoreductase n=1 Tax=Tectimicrobiota bacterium TaxID=2528274 RepID=A0A938B0Q7_UNCTE|nr:NADP-dependent oxidoreductase [Candidatus Tectomicrobia bacterium]
MNQQWTLARTPTDGLPTDDDFRWGTRPIPVPGPRQMLTRTIYLSLDPYQWGRRRSGVEAVGDVCHGRTVSQVVQSNIPAYQEGDFVFNTNGWQEYGLTGEGISVFNYMFPRKLDPAQAPISTAVGVLGMLGLTAYSGLYLQCQPRAGETVVVSAASGGVGQIVGQLGKIFGCRVVGIAGVQAKCDFVTQELGFDACVSHLSPTLEADLKAACPDGIDVYFENVGGKVFTAVLPQLNRQARISLCGLVSQYGVPSQGDPHDAWMAQGQPTFARQQVQAHRLVVGTFVAQHQSQFLHDMAGWIQAGKIKYKEDLWPGLAQAPQAFRAMLEGGNFGKTLVGVGDDPTLDVTLQQRRAGGNVLGGAR